MKPSIWRGSLRRCPTCQRFRRQSSYYKRKRNGNCYGLCKECSIKDAKSHWKPEYHLQYYRKLKGEVIAAYGGSCQCCKEDGIEFLAIDHINGGGRAHRKRMNLGAGSQFYSWLRRRKWPKGYQILCHNCNIAKHHYGQCPHKLRRIYGRYEILSPVA